MECLICKNDIETEEVDEILQSVKCSGCATIYQFDRRQSIIDNRLCGPGGQLTYDYIERDVSIAAK